MAAGEQPRYALPAIAGGGAGGDRTQDPAAAVRDRLRAEHADREQVIEVLKDAFVQGRLSRDELGVRVAQTLASRTYAELAALTADIPPARPQPGRCARQPRRAAGRWSRRPPGRAAAWSSRLPPSGAPPSSIRAPRPKSRSLLGSPDASYRPCRRTGGRRSSWGTWWSPHGKRRSRRRLPPRLGPGGHAWTANGAAAPARARPPGRRADEARADLRPPRHRCTGSTSAWAGWPPVACARSQARYDAGETSTGTGASSASSAELPC